MLGLALAAVMLLAWWAPGWALAPARATGAPVAVQIPSGATAGSIARQLEEAGVIRSALAFQVAARLLGSSQSMKAGDYRIPAGRGVVEIIELLVRGAAESRWVTLPEGLTLRQAAAALQEAGLVEADEFVRAASANPARWGLSAPPDRGDLEGYLMPDSYRFGTRVSAETVVAELVRNWKARVGTPLAAEIRASGRPVDEIITIAAMIEREARIPGDRKLISSVIRNRLARKMPLQIDATVIYAMGFHKPRLTYEDLKTESPYNTYLNPGLPPGPICSPGLASVEAALRPADTSYLYYVARPDGSHIFSRTFEEHRQARALVEAGRGS